MAFLVKFCYDAAMMLWWQPAENAEKKIKGVVTGDFAMHSEMVERGGNGFVSVPQRQEASRNEVADE